MPKSVYTVSDKEKRIKSVMLEAINHDPRPNYSYVNHNLESFNERKKISLFGPFVVDGAPR